MSQPLEFSGKSFALYQTLHPAALLIANEQGHLLYADNIEQALVPASTTKLITALLALQHWGAEHHFHTDFTVYSCTEVQAINCARLEIGAFGDPFLVSEEWAIIAEYLAAQLKAQGITQIQSIHLANQWFDEPLNMPGAERSLNPYDAINGALVANFNSINVRKTLTGWESAEPQTPWTRSAQTIVENAGLSLKIAQEERINTGQNYRLNQQYALELLQTLLQQNGIAAQIGEQPLSSANPQSMRFRYRHFNRRNLAEMIRPMLKYSTNFIANQIALNLAAEIYGAPASAQSVQKLYQQKLAQQFAWQEDEVRFFDAAGLSRDNRINARQLYQVLQAFAPWRELLPEVEEGVFAKSGSLLGVSTLAGYFKHQQQWLPFVFMSNQKVPYRFRNQLAKSLKAQLP
ncbi:D-alanyl-D-alanine carboxypeptidase [Thiosulfatimonas sediminis]|uniref:D-alanyl-D-alanine carboxypeptidase n=1 Tax=Thiosulfatimonas sediminis TaxID=2675054 RepID=UPI001565367A|nr:D-alanyl-D-alanine carboxypeptidase [Thiosulfatimonas sediminis]